MCMNIKGQLISKFLLGVFNFSQKMNESKSTWGIIEVKSIFFVQFLGELRIPKSPFEINWPLEAIGGSFCGSASYNLIPLYSFFFHSQAQNIYPFFCLPELMRILNTYMPCRVDEIKFYYNCIFETFSLKSQFSIKHSHSVFGSV